MGLGVPVATAFFPESAEGLGDTTGNLTGAVLAETLGLTLGDTFMVAVGVLIAGDFEVNGILKPKIETAAKNMAGRVNAFNIMLQIYQKN